MPSMRCLQPREESQQDAREERREARVTKPILVSRTHCLAMSEYIFVILTMYGDMASRNNAMDVYSRMKMKCLMAT